MGRLNLVLRIGRSYSSCHRTDTSPSNRRPLRRSRRLAHHDSSTREASADSCTGGGIWTAFIYQHPTHCPSALQWAQCQGSTADRCHRQPSWPQDLSSHCGGQHGLQGSPFWPQTSTPSRFDTSPPGSTPCMCSHRHCLGGDEVGGSAHSPAPLRTRPLQHRRSRFGACPARAQVLLVLSLPLALPFTPFAALCFAPRRPWYLLCLDHWISCAVPPIVLSAAS